jgi:zinc transport system substrate-binding protein
MDGSQPGSPPRRAPFRVVLPALLLLTGCAATSPGRSRPGAAPKLRVVTTALPVTLFTRAVAAGCATVEPLLPLDVDPHDAQASPADLARLRRADVLVINGLGLESHLDRLIASAAPPDLRLIDAGRGIASLAGEGHRQARGAGAVNPHVWLDPRRAARQVATIRDGLVAADPRCRVRYRANAAEFLARLDRLDAELAGRLAPFSGRTVLTPHDIAPYFAARYGLATAALVEVPGESPTPADLQRLQRRSRQAGTSVVLSDPRAGGSALRSLAADLHLQVVPFDPLETATSARDVPIEHYAATMRSNAAALADALAR